MQEKRNEVIQGEVRDYNHIKRKVKRGKKKTLQEGRSENNS